MVSMPPRRRALVTAHVRGALGMRRTRADARGLAGSAHWECENREQQVNGQGAWARHQVMLLSDAVEGKIASHPVADAIPSLRGSLQGLTVKTMLIPTRPVTMFCDDCLDGRRSTGYHDLGETIMRSMSQSVIRALCVIVAVVAIAGCKDGQTRDGYPGGGGHGGHSHYSGG